MVENMTPELQKQLLDKKMESRGNEKTRNFSVSDELTVTITLDEYRDLVGKDAVASAKYDKLILEKAESDAEKKKLQEEVAILRKQLIDLQYAADQVKSATDVSITEGQ